MVGRKQVRVEGLAAWLQGPAVVAVAVPASCQDVTASVLECCLLKTSGAFRQMWNVQRWPFSVRVSFWEQGLGSSGF